jgi:phosphoglucomutase
MAESFQKILAATDQAVAEGKLLESTAKNIRSFLTDRNEREAVSRCNPDFESVRELVERSAWSELNDRFYKTLAFGTGGLRGRTIGKIVTAAERGRSEKNEPPEFPCVGTNAMNFYNVTRATRGLVAYLREWLDRQKLPGKPKIIIAHDTRFFSKQFSDLAAKVAVDDGFDAFVFDGPRSTPELSFAVRYLTANAGIVITASHNPSHDNGYKVYFDDGGQVIEPHASGIIAKVNASDSEPAGSQDRQGTLTRIGAEVDEAYMQRLETLVLNPKVVRSAKSFRIVFTPLHGTGGIILKPMLQRLGFAVEVVAEQDRFDGSFPTVKSPNPENAEALSMGIDLAQKTNADLVLATDPDCDRVGVAVQTSSRGMKLLTGNQIASLIAWYRVKTLFDQGVLTKKNAERAVIIKTFVTTDLLKVIAKHYGVRCLETLTGFKYIGAKLAKYERALPVDLRKKYRQLPEAETRAARLQHSAYYIFGGEESYGFSGADFEHDKDGNGAAIMFCEVAAYATSQSLTVDRLLDQIYAEFGYFEEMNGSLVFEGAEGAEKIARLLESYASEPFVEVAGSKVIRVTNFATETIRDIEGDEIPKEKMSIFALENRTRIAVRASGTEPKIKYYLFAEHCPRDRKFELAELGRIKTQTHEWLTRVWNWLQADARKRVAR